MLSLNLLYPCVLDDARPKRLLASDDFAEFRRGVREGQIPESEHTRAHLRGVHDCRCFAVEPFDDDRRSLGRHAEPPTD